MLLNVRRVVKDEGGSGRIYFWDEVWAKSSGSFPWTGEAARVFSSFSYRTLESWSRERRVVGKAEWTLQGENPRFVVTSLKPWLSSQLRKM